MIHTGRCKHCGKTKEEHVAISGGNPSRLDYCRSNAHDAFEDSGLAALDAHKEELYEAIKNHRNAKTISELTYTAAKVDSILNQIEKEK